MPRHSWCATRASTASRCARPTSITATGTACWNHPGLGKGTQRAQSSAEGAEKTIAGQVCRAPKNLVDCFPLRRHSVHQQQKLCVLRAPLRSLRPKRIQHSVTTIHRQCVLVSDSCAACPKQLRIALPWAARVLGLPPPDGDWGHRVHDRAREQLDQGQITEAAWYATGEQALIDAYLATADPIRASGKRGDAVVSGPGGEVVLDRGYARIRSAGGEVSGDWRGAGARYRSADTERILIELGATEQYSLYLLQGSLLATTQNGDETRFSAGDDGEIFPIAQIRPSMYRVVTAEQRSDRLGGAERHGAEANAGQDRGRGGHDRESRENGPAQRTSSGGWRMSATSRAASATWIPGISTDGESR